MLAYPIAPLGFNEARAKLRKLVDKKTYDTIMFMIAEKVAITGQSLVSDPPVQERRELPKVYTRLNRFGEAYKSKFKSQKQQGYFFAYIVPEGNFPYKRGRGTSEQLTAQLGTLPYTIKKNRQVYTVTWGVDASYAALVVGSPDEQADYHKDVWTPLADDIMSPKAIAKYENVVETELEGAINAFLK